MNRKGTGEMEELWDMTISSKTEALFHEWEKMALLAIEFALKAVLRTKVGRVAFNTS